jgi:riboflavin biosynthesis pyrimidine reductase
MALTSAGASVVPVARATAGSEGLDLAAGLAALLDHRVLTVLAEPGPRLAEALIVAGLVDYVELHVAGAASGRSGTRGTVVAAIEPLAPLVEAWRRGADVVTVDVLDEDIVLRAAWCDLAGGPEARPHVASGASTGEAA